MSTVFIAASTYALVSLISILWLLGLCKRIRSLNLRLLAKASCLAFFLTPTLSVPATLPMPF